MKEKIGEVFSVARDNPPIPGCTVSREITEREQYVAYYSLAACTDISAEIYTYHKLLSSTTATLRTSCLSSYGAGS
mgnify:FL=1